MTDVLSYFHKKHTFSIHSAIRFYSYMYIGLFYTVFSHHRCGVGAQSAVFGSLFNLPDLGLQEVTQNDDKNCLTDMIDM